MGFNKKRYYNLKFSSSDIENKTYRHYFGGGPAQWEERGRFQLELLKELGLKPQSRFLDVGCGALRGGVHFIDYLEKGHYCGIDINPDLLKAGLKEIEEKNLSSKMPVLKNVQDFKFGDVGPFDYAFAFAVIDSNILGKCLIELQKVVRIGGKVYLTHSGWFKKKFGLQRRKRNIFQLIKGWFNPCDLGPFEVTEIFEEISQVDKNFDQSKWHMLSIKDSFPIVELTLQRDE